MKSPPRRKILLLLLAALVLSATAAEAVVVTLPALDMVGEWSYVHQTGKGTKNDPIVEVRELTFSNFLVTQSVIEMGEVYNQSNELPGVEEIINAEVVIDVLVREELDNWTFSGGNLTITEGSDYLTGILTNVTFNLDPYNDWVAWLNAELDTDNLITLSTYPAPAGPPSRFIDVLTQQMIDTGLDYTNMRIEMQMNDGPLTGFAGGFFADSSGATVGKLEGIPEPGTAVLLGLGLTALAGLVKKKK